MNTDKEIRELIKVRKSTIDELVRLRDSVLHPNLGKKLTKRHLGTTPQSYYGDDKGPRFRHTFWLADWPNRASKTIEFHDPVIEEDLEQLTRFIKWEMEAIKRIENLISNKPKVIQARLELDQAHKAFTDALDRFQQLTLDLDDKPELYKEYFGIKYKERTHFVREY